MKVQQNRMFAFEKTPKTQSYGVKATFRNTEGQQSVLAVKLCVYKYVSSTTLSSFCSLLKIEWKKYQHLSTLQKLSQKDQKLFFQILGHSKSMFFSFLTQLLDFTQMLIFDSILFLIRNNSVIKYSINLKFYSSYSQNCNLKIEGALTEK